MEQGPWVAPVQEVVQEVAPRRDLVARREEAAQLLVAIRGAQVDPRVVVDLDQLQAADLLVLQEPGRPRVVQEVSLVAMFGRHDQRLVRPGLVGQMRTLKAVLTLRRQNQDLRATQSPKKTAKLSKFKFIFWYF